MEKEETFTLYYRHSLSQDPDIIAQGLDYESALELQLFFSHSCECSVEKNYQGIPVKIGVYFEEEA